MGGTPPSILSHILVIASLILVIITCRTTHIVRHWWGKWLYWAILYRTHDVAQSLVLFYERRASWIYTFPTYSHLHSSHIFPLYLTYFSRLSYSIPQLHHATYPLLSLSFFFSLLLYLSVCLIGGGWRAKNWAHVILQLDNIQVSVLYCVIHSCVAWLSIMLHYYARI